MSFPNVGVEDKSKSYEGVIAASPQYNAITGAELLDIILNHMKTELSQHDEFRVHLTYPKFMYSVKLDVDVFTSTLPLQKEVKSPPVVETTGLDKQHISKTVGTKKPIDVPDAARDKAGLPTSGQIVTEAGVFDVPKPKLTIL